MRDAAARHNRIRRTVLAVVLCSLLVFTALAAGAGPAFGEAVTDTITIKVGYWGMNEEDYLEKATFHWTELDDAFGGALQTHEEAYSFFRDAEDGTYSTVLVSARGFYLEDLLNYAGVNMSDVQNISFYTLDHAYGAFTSFTYEQLFEEPRYYFEDLPSKIRNKYNKAGILTGYEIDDSVWDDKTRVQTMLALESSWAQYDAGTEHAFPDYENMGAGTRFRLLFGQNDPAEVRTSQSAKYVHTIALTIPGAPKVKAGPGSGDGKILLSNQIGRHQVSFHVAADQAMLASIMGNLVWSSTDERVLHINDVSMTPSEQYSDAVEVVIDYEVYKEGQAGITGSYMGMELEGESVEIAQDAGSGSSKQDGSGPGGKGGSGSSKSSGASKKNSSGGSQGNAAAGRLSLVPSGGSVTTAAADAPAAAQTTADGDPGADAAASQPLYGVDLEDVLAPEESAAIVKQDKSRQYAPLICGAVGGILAMGGTASAMQFRWQTGRLQIGRRRRV